MLDAGKLERSLASLFRSPEGLRSQGDAEARWADAYVKYALDAEDVSKDRVAVVNAAGFRSSLSFENSQKAAAFSRELDQAFLSFWTGAVFSVGIPPTPAAQCASVGGNGIFGTELTSTVIAVVPGVMQAKVLPVISSFTGQTTADQKAREVARAIHSATTGAVTVLITGLDTTPSPAGPLPIVNTCQIF